MIEVGEVKQTIEHTGRISGAKGYIAVFDLEVIALAFQSSILTEGDAGKGISRNMLFYLLPAKMDRFRIQKMHVDSFCPLFFMGIQVSALSHWGVMADG